MKVYLAILISILLVACTPEPLSIEIPQLEQKLVLNSQVIPDQAIVVHLSRSFDALDGADSTDESSFIDSLLVSGATVTISYDGTVETLQELQAGFYGGITAPQTPGMEFTVECYDPVKNLSCRATSRILPFVGFNSLDPVYNAGADSSLDLKFRFIDPSEENYYMLNVYGRVEEESFEDDFSFFNSGSNVLITSQIFTDRTFTSDSVQANINLRGIASDDSLAITFSNISKDYYNYLALRNKSGNLFSEITQEPINYPTNVEGGYGFFNTHFPDVRLLLVADLPQE